MTVELLPAPSSKVCKQCGKGMPPGKRPHAVYCSRSCKNRASELRRNPRSDKIRYQKERQRRLEYARVYQKANPHVPQRAKRKRKARMAGAGILHISKQDWLRLVARYNGKCFYCGAAGRMSMDHVVPISRGGRHSIGNVVPACITCNSSKRDRTIMEWRLGRSVKRDRTDAAAASSSGSDLGEDARRLLVSA